MLWFTGDNKREATTLVVLIEKIHRIPSKEEIKEIITEEMKEKEVRHCRVPRENGSHDMENGPHRFPGALSESEEDNI